jgi:hypothetical protein
MLECLLNELFYNFSSSYCKFVSHVRFVWSSFSFWVDLCDNDTVFWVSCNCDCVNCRFWVNRQTVILSFADKSWSSESARSIAFWKEKTDDDDDDDILLRDVIFRSNLLTSLISWISMLERIFNSCQKARFSESFSVWIVCKSYFCSVNWFRANRKIFRLLSEFWHIERKI